jgi:hypothetical protein
VLGLLRQYVLLRAGLQWYAVVLQSMPLLANGAADTRATARGRDVRGQTELSPRDATQRDGVTQSSYLLSVGA